MLRILKKNKTHYYLFLGMNLKPEIEFYFQFMLKKSINDFWAKSFVVRLCLAYGLITFVFVDFIWNEKLLINFIWEIHIYHKKKFLLFVLFSLDQLLEVFFEQNQPECLLSK